MSDCCDKCGNAGSTKLCTRCRDRRYCSVDCQRQDWASHKVNCRPNYCQEINDIIDRAIEDEAITSNETKSLKLSIKRIEGSYNNRDCEPSNIGLSDKDTRKMQADCFCIYASTALFSVGRGVMVERKNRAPQFGYIVDNGTDHGQVEAKKLESMWKKKKRQTFDIKFVDESGEEGETISGVEAHCMRMVPIRDLRHIEYSMSFDEEVPAGVDLDEYSFEHENLPDGISWQYLDPGTGSWVNYPKGLAGRIESMYAANSPHYLYTPGNPHCVGQMVPEAVLGQEVGTVRNAFLHDTSTNQIIFEVSSRGNWVRGHHTQTDNMTERNFYTGMQRRVRRVGGVPRSGGDSDGHKQQQKYLFESGYVDWTDTREKCGLCGKTEGPFMTTECCGRTLCDTEGQYRVNSYEREGQCARNHRLNSICYHHHAEGHDGDWKECTRCQEDFHPYDYAVKATSQAQSGTIRRYNFDDNVRTDIHPADVPFPQCDACGLNVDTTEETVRTLGMRKTMGGGKVTCANCGGGFGKITFV